MFPVSNLSAIVAREKKQKTLVFSSVDAEPGISDGTLGRNC